MQRAFPPCSFLTPGAASWILKITRSSCCRRCKKSFPDSATGAGLYYTRLRVIFCPRWCARSQLLSVDWRIPLAEVAKWRPARALQGNLDPAIVRDIRGNLDIAPSFPAWTYSESWHGILQHTPVESAQLFVHTGQQAALHQAQPAVQMRAERGRERRV